MKNTLISFASYTGLPGTLRWWNKNFMPRVVGADHPLPLDCSGGVARAGGVCHGRAWGLQREILGGKPRGGAGCVDFEDLYSHQARFFCLAPGCAAEAAPYPGELSPRFSSSLEALAGPG